LVVAIVDLIVDYSKPMIFPSMRTKIGVCQALEAQNHGLGSTGDIWNLHDLMTEDEVDAKAPFDASDDDLKPLVIGIAPSLETVKPLNLTITESAVLIRWLPLSISICKHTVCLWLAERYHPC
jgi:hypothetical protein